MVFKSLQTQIILIIQKIICWYNFIIPPFPTTLLFPISLVLHAYTSTSRPNYIRFWNAKRSKYSNIHLQSKILSKKISIATNFSKNWNFVHWVWPLWGRGGVQGLEQKPTDLPGMWGNLRGRKGLSMPFWSFQSIGFRLVASNFNKTSSFLGVGISTSTCCKQAWNSQKIQLK